VRINNWEEMKGIIYKRRWTICVEFLAGLVGTYLSSYKNSPLWLLTWLLLLFSVIPILFNDKPHKHLSKSQKKVINIVMYVFPVVSIIYGILRGLVNTLPNGIFENWYSYILYGVILLVLLLYWDFIKPKKIEDKNNTEAK